MDRSIHNALDDFPVSLLAQAGGVKIVKKRQSARISERYVGCGGIYERERGQTGKARQSGRVRKRRRGKRQKTKREVDLEKAKGNEMMYVVYIDGHCVRS
jgi:hypothetical protein